MNIIASLLYNKKNVLFKHGALKRIFLNTCLIIVDTFWLRGSQKNKMLNNNLLLLILKVLLFDSLFDELKKLSSTKIFIFVDSILID
jgi:hypothetical protein